MRAGDLIRERRLSLNLSIREVARLAGVNHSDLSRVETGQMRPSAKLSAQVCEVLGLKLTDLYGLEDEAAEAPAEDMVQQIRAILIRGHWPPQIRDSVVGIVRATKPAQVDSLGHDNAKNLLLVGVR